MSNMAITDWLTFTPAGVVRNAKAYIDLPAFSYSAQGTAGEASIIVAQFNFSASRDFYLLTRPTKPSGVNYGLCIRWRVGETVYRYKLWEDASFVLNNETPLYNRQRIRANFVLEIWNFAGSASSNAAAIRMITSVRTAPTDFRSITDYALAVGAEFTDFASIAPTLPSGVTNRWTMVNSTWYPWTDSVGGVPLNAPGSIPSYEVADATWTKGRLKFVTGSNRKLVGQIPNTSWGTFTMYIVAALDTSGSFQRTLLELTNFLSVRMGNTDKVRVGGWSTGFADFTVPDADPHIYCISVTDLGGASSGLTLMLDDTYVGGGLITPPNYASDIGVKVGDEYSGSNDGEINIAEILMFKGMLIPFGFDTDAQVKRYLRWYHFGEIPLPASFNAGSAWLDNAPL
jgi:hypothetical protein